MSLRAVRRGFLAAALVLFAFAAGAEVAVPPLTGRVTDVTGTLSAEQRTSIEARLAAFEQRKGTQIAVLLVPTTQPETIDQYGIRVVDQWKLGRKGVDDGALLLVALNDRRMRIEVGRGLEGVMPDAVAKRIIAEDITPRFKQGDFFGGIDTGVTRMIGVIDGEPLPPPRGSAQRSSSGALDALPQMLVIAVILAVVGGGIVRAIFGRFLGSTIVGAAGGVLGWTMLGSVVAGGIMAIVVLLFSLMGGMSGRRGWGGWSSGGFGGGGFGGGGGGFGGGGGSFGGGGASGSW